MTLHDLSWPGQTSPPDRRWRSLTATLIYGASRALDRLALRLLARPTAPAEEPLLEFHADAGAPEGALYVNGLLIGRLDGVKRL